MSAISSGLAALALPQQISACLFDLDGVLTDTARLNTAGWMVLFDSYLRAGAARGHARFATFDPVEDHEAYVDGKPRADGTRAFLASRGIDLPEGHPGDRPDAQTVQGLGNRKNEIVLRRIRRHGVQAYPGSVAYVPAVRDAGLRRAVVSSSTNCRDVPMAAHIEDLFEQRIDGLTAQQEHLAGIPAPDMYLAAAHALGVEPGGAAVFEDALAGIAAGRAGGFGYVLGVDGQAEQLAAHGADMVVTDLADPLSQR